MSVNALNNLVYGIVTYAKIYERQNNRRKAMEKNNLVNIPTDFQRIKTLPEDPANAVAYAKATQSSNMFLMIFPIENQKAMPYGDEKTVIDGIHGALAEDQGLVEVKSGMTSAQKRYIYSVVKSKLQPSGIQYILTMHIDAGSHTVNIQLNCDETGMTGIRDTAIMNKMINEGKITPPAMEGWFSDPYDDNYKKGLLRNESEKPEYDALFPQHPLSETRNLIKYIIENN